MPDSGKRGISTFIVPTKTPGYLVTRIEDKMGQRASDTCQIVPEDVAVPLENRLGEEGEGYQIALANLESGRIGIASQAVGLARSAFDAALAYAKERKTFSKAIIDHQAVGFRLADMATEIESARQLVRHASALHDARAALSGGSANGENNRNRHGGKGVFGCATNARREWVS